VQDNIPDAWSLDYRDGLIVAEYSINSRATLEIRENGEQISSGQCTRLQFVHRANQYCKTSEPDSMQLRIGF
tara:strand:+ start:67 stop:282 length:216 start_codon:yes stop_codon:yes gene_type:complete